MAPKRWLYLVLLKVPSQHLPPLAGFTVDMFVERANLAGRGKRSAPGISLGVAIAERLELYAAILTEKERSRNGKKQFPIIHSPH